MNIIYLFRIWPYSYIMNMQHRGYDCPNKCPGYDTKQPDDEAPMMLELLLSSLPGPSRSGVVAPDRVLSMGQIEINCVLMLNWIIWNGSVYMNKNVFSIK